jgi:small subunit ribosomal protein S36
MTRPPRLVLLATVAFGVLTAFWSVFTPLTEAPDEPAHLGLVYYIVDNGEYPAYDELQHTEGLFQLCVDFATSANWCRIDAERAANVFTRDRPAAEAPSKHDRVLPHDPDFVRLKAGRMNQMAQHPPLYYLAMAGAVHVERAVWPGELSVDTELAYLRLLNGLIVLPLPWLAWLLARRLGASPAVCAAAALAPLGVPQLTHIGATLNNDNLFVVVASALMVLLAGVVRGDRSARTAALVGLTTGVALLTKGFGIVLPPVVAAAYLVGAASAGGAAHAPGLWRRRWSAVVTGTGAMVVAFVVGGWWYLDNLVTTGHVMPSIENKRLAISERPLGWRPHFSEYGASAVARLVEGFWGAFGWRRVELPTVISAVATVACLAVMVVAFRRPRGAGTTGPNGDRGHPDPATDPSMRALAPGNGHGASSPALAPTGLVTAPGNGHGVPEPMADASPPVTRPQLAVLLVPVVLLTTFVLVRSAVIYYDSGRLAFQQGRYLFAGLTAAAVVVATGLVRLFGTRAVPLTLAAAVLLQGAAVATCLHGWWGADGVPFAAWNATVAWSGWPDPLAIVILLGPPLPLVLLARGAWRYHLSLSAAPPPTAPQVRPGQLVGATR